MRDADQPRVNVAEAKRTFSELVARVAYRGETIVITRRGRPMAKLVPPAAEADAGHVANVPGWLKDEDPFLGIIDAIVDSRARHVPRVASRAASGRRKK